MRPLVFLFFRSFCNGVKRSLTSPKRTISLIFFALYYVGLIMRPFTHDEPLAVPNHGFSLSLPSRYVLDGVVFGIMALASLIMMSGILTYRGGFRPADVDVLFATPIQPRVVLAFRVLRDYLLTLIFPLVFGVLGFRATRLGWESLISNYPAHGADMIRMTWLAWMLMALGWVALGYGTSLFVGRSDLQSDKNRRVITYGIATAVVAVLVYVGARLYLDLSWTSALQIARSPLLRLALFPATAATAVAIGGIEGDPVTLALGVAGCLGIIFLGYGAALSQVDWLYDQAAARGFDSINLRKLRRSGNQYALLGEYARKCKLKRRWFAERVSRHTYRRGPALVWKELILQSRGPLAQGVVLGVTIVLGLGGLTWLTGRLAPEKSALTIVSCLFCCAYMFSLIIGLTGFQEMLRRADLLKPLPFTAGGTIWWEVVGKAPIPASIMLLGGLGAAVMDPRLAGEILGAELVAIPLFLEISSAILFTLVLFPDFEDPTQRGLSGIFMMLSIIVCSAPGLVLFYGLVLGKNVSMLVVSIPSAALLLAVAGALAAAAGQIYAGYNPSE